MKAKLLAASLTLSAFLGAGIFVHAETSNPVQIFVRPSVVCYATDIGGNKKTSFFVNETVRWVAEVLPAGQSYNYVWSGTDQLSGNVGVASKAYTTVGNKTARVVVTSNITVPTGVDLSKTADCNIPTGTPITVTEVPKPDLTANAPTPSLTSTGTTNEYYAGTGTLAGSVFNRPSASASALGSFTNEYSFKLSSNNTWLPVGAVKGLTDTRTLAIGDVRTVAISDPLVFNGSIGGVSVDIRLCANRSVSPLFTESDSTDPSNCAQKTIVIKSRPTATLDLTVTDDNSADKLQGAGGTLSNQKYAGVHTLKWTSANIASCTSADFATGGAAQNTTGVVTVPMVNPEYNYIITCTATAAAGGGILTDTVTVKTLPPTVSCSASAASVYLNKPVSFTATPNPNPLPSGVVGSYSYAWTSTGADPSAQSGTSNLYSVKGYDTVGNKTASVTLTAPGNRTASATCPTSGSVSVGEEPKPDLTANAPAIQGLTATGRNVTIGGFTMPEYYEGTATLGGSVNNIGNASASGSFSNVYQSRAAYSGGALGWTTVDVEPLYLNTATLTAGETGRNVKSSAFFPANQLTDGWWLEYSLCADQPTSVVDEGANEGNNCSNARALLTRISVVKRPTPTVTLTATSRVSYAKTATITWSATNVAKDSCIGTGFTTNGSTSGSVTTGPLTNTSYQWSVKCDGLPGSSPSSVTATASTDVDPPTLSCTASAPSVYLNKPVTFTATPNPNPLPSGVVGSYSYAWASTGADPSSQSGASNTYAVKGYDTVGNKTASVTLTAPGNRTASATCPTSGSVSVGEEPKASLSVASTKDSAPSSVSVSGSQTNTGGTTTYTIVKTEKIDTTLTAPEYDGDARFQNWDCADGTTAIAAGATDIKRLCTVSVPLGSAKSVTARYASPSTTGTSQSLSCTALSPTSVRLTYGYENLKAPALYRGSTAIKTLTPPTGSGTHDDAGLTPNTEYTYTLKNGATTLKTAVCKTTAPDLTANAPTPSLESAGAGKYYPNTAATLSGSVKNTGTADANGKFASRYSYRARVDANPAPAPYDDTKGTWTIISDNTLLNDGTLPPDGSLRTVANSNATAFNVGTAEIRLCADTPAYPIIESNENNNCASQIVTIISKQTLTVQSTKDGSPSAVPVSGSQADTGGTTTYTKTKTEKIDTTLTATLEFDGLARFSEWSGCNSTASLPGEDIQRLCSVVVGIGASAKTVTARYLSPGIDPQSLSCAALSPTSIRLTYAYKNIQSPGLFRGASSVRTLMSPSGSGTHDDTGLAPNTEYTYTLKNGTTILKTAVCKTTATDLTANAPTPSLELIAGTTNEYYENTNATLSGSVNNIGNASAPGTFTNEYSFKLSSVSSWNPIGANKGLASTGALDAYPPSIASNTNRPVLPSDPTAFNGSTGGVSMDIRLCANRTVSTTFTEKDSFDASNCAQRTIVVKKLPVPVLNTPTPIVAGCTPRVGANGLVVSWSSVSAASYTLYVINGQTLQTRTISGITGTSYTDNNLTPGVEYRYRVSGIFGAGKEGPLSETKSAVVPAACFDYDLSANNATVEVGKSVTTTATRTLLWGATQSVALSITSVIAPNTASVTGTGSSLSLGSGSVEFKATVTSANPAAPTAVSNIKIDTKSQTPTGSYTVGVRGVGTEILANGQEQTVIRDTQFSVSVTAKGEEKDVACSLAATPSSVSSGGSSALSWSSQNAAVCTGTNFSTGTGNATSNTTGVSTGALTQNTAYSLSCRNANATKTCSQNVTVTVTGGENNPPPPGNPPPGNPPPPNPAPSGSTTLNAVCFATLQDPDDTNGDNTPNPGEQVTWTAIVSGGTPGYDYLWGGDVPLAGKQNSNDGSGSDVQKVSYGTTGQKRGSVTITDRSGNSPTAIDCEGSGITIQNPAPADFSLDATPSTIYIERFRGGATPPPSSQTTIAVAPQGGFSSTVSLSATPVRITKGGVSANVTFSWGDQTLSSSEFIRGSSFSASLSEWLPDGGYPLTVRGTSGGRRRNVEVLLQVVTVKPTFEEF